jgi:hypothetical protein
MEPLYKRYQNFRDPSGADDSVEEERQVRKRMQTILVEAGKGPQLKMELEEEEDDFFGGKATPAPTASAPATAGAAIKNEKSLFECLEGTLQRMVFKFFFGNDLPPPPNEQEDSESLLRDKRMVFESDKDMVRFTMLWKQHKDKLWRYFRMRLSPNGGVADIHQSVYMSPNLVPLDSLSTGVINLMQALHLIYHLPAYICLMVESAASDEHNDCSFHDIWHSLMSNAQFSNQYVKLKHILETTSQGWKI